MAPALLEVRGISKRFGGHQALTDVALDVRAGEVHAIAGENGAGKSTLMAVLTGALVPDAGTLAWDGRDATLGDVRAARALGIGIVHQEPQLVPSLSVAENVCLGTLPERGLLRLVDLSALRRAALEALEGVHARLDPDLTVGSLGVAHRQLVAIARALRFGARLIILDEPTSSLSLAEVEVLLDAIRRLRARGTSLLYISHRLEEVRAIADRITVLRDGRVVRTAAMTETTNDDVVRAMSGRPAERAAEQGPSLAGASALEVSGLARRGRLHDVSLHVRAGEVVGLAGLMGAGRSRLLRTIFGADPADTGEVWIASASARFGRDRVRSVRGAIAAGVAFVPEDRRGQGLVLTGSVLDNVGLRTPAGAARRGILRPSVLRAAAEAAVRALRIRTRGVDEPVRFLSGGNQQKVVLARWLRKDVRVLLLDEPTRGVDVAAKAEIHGHLRRLAREGLALLVASSEIPELLAVCDRLYVMRGGRIVGERVRASVTPEEILRLATGAEAA
jgi:ABC-type sugar transport system ATPase subunit